MKKRIRVFLAGLFLAVCLFTPLTALAEIPYNAFTYDSEERPIWMPSPYVPVKIIGQSLMAEKGEDEYEVVKGLSTPEDICMDKEGFLYVADKDNNRIVKMNPEGVIQKIFGTDESGNSFIRAPEGVYVDELGLVYVADTGNQQVVIFDRDGEVVNTIAKPDDIRLKDVVFTPVKLTVDARGYIFVISRGGNEGLLILSPDGRFHGFFGRNATELNVLEKVKRLFYTKEQIATNNNSRAVTISGVVQGEDGYLYTCTQNIKSGQIKKFNASGEDLFDNNDFKVKIPSWATEGKAGDSSIAAVTVDRSSNIYAVDQTNGAVIVYGNQKQTLAIFGRKLSSVEQRVGVFGMANGIAVAENGNLYVLDKQYNGVHVFHPTELFQKILEAVVLYNDGLYQEAVPLWKEILKENSNYYMAHLGLGKAAYVSGDWETAMSEMKVALDQENYSEAYWQHRSAWLQKNSTGALLLILAVIAVYQLIGKIFHFSPLGWVADKWKKFSHKLTAALCSHTPGVRIKLEETAYAFRILKHPADTFYGASRAGKASVGSAVIIFAIYVAVKLAAAACTSFSFNKFGLAGMTLMDVALSFIAPTMLWVLGSYLVGAITKGQGSLRAVFITAVYCLIPQIVWSVPIALLSNLLTRDEIFIYYFLVALAAAWTGIYLFLQMKEVQGYDFGEAVKRLFLVFFTIAIAIVLAAAIYGISIQAYNLANELIREVLGFV